MAGIFCNCRSSDREKPKKLSNLLSPRSLLSHREHRRCCARRSRAKMLRAKMLRATGHARMVTEKVPQKTEKDRKTELYREKPNATANFKFGTVSFIVGFMQTPPALKLSIEAEEDAARDGPCAHGNQ